MEPNQNETQNFNGLAYAVITMKTGEKLYYTRNEAVLFASIADDYVMKRLSYIGVHKSLESLVDRKGETLVLMKNEDVETIEFHGVHVGRQTDGQTHFAEFQLG